MWGVCGEGVELVFVEVRMRNMYSLCMLKACVRGDSLKYILYTSTRSHTPLCPHTHTHTPLLTHTHTPHTALHQAGQHLQDSVLASYTALLIGLLVKHNHDNIDFVKDSLPSKSFSELIGMMKKFVSFMNMTVSV